MRLRRAKPAPAPADVCLLIEGAYPYVAGGVSSWVQDLIRAHADLSFHVVALVADRRPRRSRYELPPNVSGLSHVYIQDLPAGRGSGAEARRLFEGLRAPLRKLWIDGDLEALRAVAARLAPRRDSLGSRMLLDSEAAFAAVSEMYEETHRGGSFLHYFWTWRVLLGGLFSTLLAPLPPARVYHTISTGYAGLLAARARIETGRPALLTEHGIYANERRIEILMADWLFDMEDLGLSLESRRADLRELWVSLFRGYARLCYEACDRIVTLYEGNQRLQFQDGAPPERALIVPNGIDPARYAGIARPGPEEPPTVGLIGRVVPIKDVKTFLRACALLRAKIPNLRALVMGPTDEDAEYYEECRAFVAHAGLGDTVEFLGRVKVEEHLPRLHAVALTSISEAQPLVILEAGAAGIPTVATDVGSCRELLFGRSDEHPSLGPGGAVAPVGAPQEIAAGLARLLADAAHRERCGEAMRERVRRYYDKGVLDRTYRALYDEAAAAESGPVLAEAV